jgi:type I restriction enzyme S subunit
MKEDWVSDELGNIFLTTSGGTPSRRNDDYYKGSILWVKSGELDKGVIFDTEEKISEEAVKNSSAKIFPKGTLLIALYGATIGKLAFLGVEAATNQAICGIFKNDNIDSKFLYNFLLFRRPKLISQGTGGAQPNISQTILKKLEFPFPSRPEQRAIVLKIETLFASLDKGIADLKTAQEQLKVYRQAVLKKAFEGGFTATNVGKDVACNVSTASTNDCLTDSKDARPPVSTDKDNLPKGWKWVKLGEVLKTINNGYTPTSQYLSEGSGEIPFIKVYNLTFNGKLDFTKNPTFIPEEIHNTKLKRSICYPGDVLINIVGPPLGKISIVPDNFPEWNINQAIVMFRPNEQILSKFLSYFFQNHVTIQWLEGTSKATAGQYNVKVSTCREIPIKLPNVKEQHAIVREIESRLSVCDKVEQSISEALEKAEALRQSILKKAFEGKLLSEAEIAKCKQEPDYEPAAKLLERIKKEKHGK